MHAAARRRKRAFKEMSAELLRAENYSSTVNAHWDQRLREIFALPVSVSFDTYELAYLWDELQRYRDPLTSGPVLPGRLPHRATRAERRAEHAARRAWRDATGIRRRPSEAQLYLSECLFLAECDRILCSPEPKIPREFK